MARRILGLTRLSAVLSWRLGLTHAKLEESTSCIPSCYGPSWHLQSWLLQCNGLTTYRNFRAQGLSDTTWMPWMHWYRAAQAAIGEELWITTCQKMMYCKLQMLFTIVYCSEPTKRIQAILVNLQYRQSCLSWWTLQSRMKSFSAESSFTMSGAGISPTWTS